MELQKLLIYIAIVWQGHKYMLLVDYALDAPKTF